jgi:hypothetical protein
MANGPVQNELKALGARLPVAYNYVAPRPFLFGGIITDASLTAADLTVEANIYDQELRANYGGGADNPQIMLLVEQFKFEFEIGTELAAVASDLLENVYIHHLATGGRSSYIMVNQFASGVITEATGADASFANRSRPAYLLPTPWLINLNSDTFEVAPVATVASVANVPFTVTAYGYAWSVAQGAGRPVECPNDAQAAALSIEQRRSPVVTR